MIQVYGTPKQQKYAGTIIAKFSRRYPSAKLPDIGDPQFWIDNKDSSLEQLLENSQDAPIRTPFTATYPRYGREDAIKAVKALGDDFVVLDLETTGLKRNAEDIIEIAVVHYSGVTLMDTLVQPADLGDYRASKAKGITKISPDELLQAPTFYDIAETLRDIVTSYHTVTFNAYFDINFIIYAYHDHGLEVPQISATCAMKIASAYFNYPDINISLADACEKLGIQQNGAHRAHADVMSTLELLKRMVE